MACSSCGKNKNPLERKRILRKPKSVVGKRVNPSAEVTKKKRPIPSRRRPR
tara:strand:- start:551 stop:703 length:153 start_codon:yes stop_codon:yes gene_type:complete